MGTYTTNYNLFMPTIGEQGWGELVNGNFTTIDTTMKGLSNRIGTLEPLLAIQVDSNKNVTFPANVIINGNVNGNIRKLISTVSTIQGSNNITLVAKIPDTECVATTVGEWGSYTIIPFYCSSLINIENINLSVTVTIGVGTSTNTSASGGGLEVVDNSGNVLLSKTGISVPTYYGGIYTVTTTLSKLMSGVKFRTYRTSNMWFTHGKVTAIEFYA